MDNQNNQNNQIENNPTSNLLGGDNQNHSHQKLFWVGGIVVLVTLAIIGGSFYVLSQNKKLESGIKEAQKKEVKLKSEIKETKDRKKGNLMMQKYYECEVRCYEEFGNRDISIVSRCKNDCRLERDRVLKEINTNSKFDIDKAFEINFYNNYTINVVSIPYKLINFDLGKVTGLAVYNNIYSEHVYKVHDQGYRVVPFPYVIKNNKIEKITGLKDLYFSPDGSYLNCENSKYQVLRCNILKSTTNNDLATGMHIKTCNTKTCKLLLAIRTNNKAHCSYLSSSSANEASLDDECRKIIDERSNNQNKNNQSDKLNGLIEVSGNYDYYLQSDNSFKKGRVCFEPAQMETINNGELFCFSNTKEALNMFGIKNIDNTCKKYWGIAKIKIKDLTSNNTVLSKSDPCVKNNDCKFNEAKLVEVVDSYNSKLSQQPQCEK